MTNSPTYDLATWQAQTGIALRLLKKLLIKGTILLLTTRFNLSMLFGCSSSSFSFDYDLFRHFVVYLNAFNRDHGYEHLTSYCSDNIDIGIQNDLLRDIMNESVAFSFNGETYAQLDGVTMGSPLGPRLANIFVG